MYLILEKCILYIFSEGTFRINLMSKSNFFDSRDWRDAAIALEAGKCFWPALALKSSRKNDILLHYVQRLTKAAVNMKTDSVVSDCWFLALPLLKARFPRKLILSNHVADIMSGRKTPGKVRLTATQVSLLLVLLPWLALSKLFRRILYEKDRDEIIPPERAMQLKRAAKLLLGLAGLLGVKLNLGTIHLQKR